MEDEPPAGSSHPLCPFCQNTLINRKVFAPGDIVAGYTVIRELGHGGMGIVYLAEQTSIKRQVALKILEDTLAKDQEFVQSFFREASAAAKLAHPNIVQAFDAGIEDGVCYFVMELIQGQNLDQYVVENGPMQIGLLLNVAVYIADALTYAWERNHLSHGDIKPENIILQNNGEIKLADLGLARDHQYDVLVPGEIMATPAYAPPEVIRGEVNRINFKADMYSFGTTLYHLATGAPPFPDEDPKIVCAKQLNNQPKPLIAIDFNIPEELSALVDQLMEKSPDHRPYSWAFVTQQLMKIRRDWNQKRSAAAVNAADMPAPNVQVETAEKFAAWNNFNCKRVIFTLSAILGVLSAVLCTMYAMGYFDTNTVLPAVNSERMTRRSQWAALKKEISSASNQKALRMIEQFIEAYKEAPEEAVAFRIAYQKLVRFENRKYEFFKFKNSVFKAVDSRIGCRPGEHPQIANEQLFSLTVFANRMDSLLLYAKQLNLTVAPDDLLTDKERFSLKRYRAALEKITERYTDTEKKYPQAIRRKFIAREAQFLLFKFACIQTNSQAVAFVQEYRSFRSARFTFLNKDDKKRIQSLALFAGQESFVSDSQYLINMKKYLTGRMVAPHIKIRDIKENGILYTSGKHKMEKMISWTDMYDLWLKPDHDLLLPVLPFMNEQDAISFYCRSLLLRRPMAYYQKLLQKTSRISPANKKCLMDITNMFLNGFTAE